MITLNMSRRGFVLSMAALAGCQTTTGVGPSADRVLTNAYDGDYELFVGRLGRDTAFYRSTGNAGREEELARLRLRSMNGSLRIVSAQDYTNAGPNFTDFKGAFYANGIVSMSFTTTFLFNVRSTYRMSFSVPVNENALRGQWMQIEPEGWDENNDAIIRLRRVM